MAKLKKGSKWQGFFIVLTLIVLLLLTVWLFAFNGSGRFSQSSVTSMIFPSSASVPVNETYQFIVYRNERYGFTLEYPVGFIAEEAELELEVFNAYAALPGQVPEVIQVIVDNSTTASSEFSDLLASAREVGESTSKVFTNSKGKEVRQITTRTILPVVPDFSSETATVYQALFDCTDSRARAYTALLIVSIPQSLQQDLPVAEYVVNSFTC